MFKKIRERKITNKINAIKATPSAFNPALIAFVHADAAIQLYKGKISREFFNKTFCKTAKEIAEG